MTLSAESDPVEQTSLLLDGPSGMLRTAEVSDCGTYRWTLTREWNAKLPRVGFVMLNPSTADAEHDDPTLRRCVGFARQWGYGSLVVRNLYALRATDPTQLWQHDAPIGWRTPAVLTACAQDALTICAWGAHGQRHNRGANVAAVLRRNHVALFHLGITKTGQPRHPLYLPGSQKPIEWSAP